MGEREGELLQGLPPKPPLSLHHPIDGWWFYSEMEKVWTTEEGRDFFVATMIGKQLVLAVAST